jgi:putative membrane protein
MAGNTSKTDGINALPWYELLYYTVFDFWSSPKLRMLSFQTIIAFGWFYLVDYYEEYFLTFEITLPYYLTYLMTYTLSMLLYFRTGTSYYKWWDGRKLFSYLSSNAKNFGTKINSFLDKKDVENRKFFSKMIINHVYSLKQQLRDERRYEEYDEPVKNYLKDNIDFAGRIPVPNQITNLITDKVFEIRKKNLISEVQFLELNKYIDSANEISRNCVTIKITPAPSSYRIHIRVFIFIFTLLLPFCFVHSYGYWIVYLMAGTYYFFAGCEVISQEIDDPFGNDKNDLPIDDICYSVKKAVKALVKLPAGSEDKVHH